MDHLIRKLILVACLLVPAISGAQLVQNSATGELNDLTLELSQATVTLNRVSVVDPALSSVTVDPPIVTADGIAFSTITVTLRDSQNQPLAGRLVSVASSRGGLDVLTQPLNPTDVNGITTGEIRSANVGLAQVLATDVADNVLLNDQPDVLFALGDVLQLTKSVGSDTAAIGDVVTYTIEIQNTTTSLISSVRIVDAAAPVLAYAEGTARLDGVAIADPVTGPPIVFDIGDLPALGDTNGNGIADPGESGYRMLTYSMIVGSGARVGSYPNTAVAESLCDGCAISQPATAELEITADPLFDLGTIIGRVFHDVDADGWFDAGEKGIGGAMVALDSGVYALTDVHGRYHFPAIEPGQRMVKIDLPRISGNAHATTDALQVLSVTPGLLAKANFGVSYVYETESIGADGEYGVKIVKDAAELPDKILGSAADLSLVINGADIGIVDARVTLSNADVNAILHLGEDGGIEPLRFALEAPGAIGAAQRWALDIWQDDNESVKRLAGDGILPAFVQWDDVAEIGELLQPGNVYYYQLEIDYGDSRITSSRRMFGVNRETAISLELSGGAFISDSAALTSEAKKLLADTARVMLEHPDEIIHINGHTDAVGSRASNQALSVARANAAFDYLIGEHEVPQERFIVAGFGEDHPVASNETASGRQLNRRVEITGQLTEVERSRLYETRTNQLVATMNGVDLPLDARGEFTQVLDAGDAATLQLNLVDELGRSIDTTVNMPRVLLAAVEGPELQAFAIDDPRFNDPNHEVADAAYSYRFVGSTDIGSRVTIDASLLPIDETGHFESDLLLTAGENNFVMSVQNESGLVRYADIKLLVTTSENGEPIVAVKPVPNLVLQLPPAGTPMRSRNLIVPGHTDPGNTVTLNGKDAAVGSDGRFAATVVLEPGRNTITARVADPRGHTGEIKHAVEFAGESLFIMALADAKISQIRREGNLQAAGADQFEETRTEGRVALYLKGTIRGKYLITAAFDTGTSEMEEMFKDLDAIENERLITNIDPDTVYPVYGDDSTLVYDTDSQSKMYLALEGESFDTVIGNYALSFDDAELTNYRRTLHGLRAQYNSSGKTTRGDSKVEVEAFVAQVDQVPVRDEIEATGGSLYFLSHSDIVEGSEQVTLLVHDQLTGLLLQRISQRRNIDYDIKYREGRVWFRRPISSVVDDGSLISADLLRGNPITVQVNYETPITGLSAGVTGARVRTRFADGKFTLGAAHVADDSISSEFTLDGVDVEMLFGSTRLVAEYAQSTGSDSLVYRSTDGGLQFAQTATAAAQEGTAIKLAAEFDIGEWFGRPDQFVGNAYYKDLSAGFVSNGNFSLNGDTQYGAAFTYTLDDRNSFIMRIDEHEVGQALSSTQSIIGWRHQRKKLGVEAEFQDRSFDDVLLSGSMAAVRASYQMSDQVSTSLEHQQAISGESRTQSAASVEYAPNDKLSLSARYIMGPDGDAWQAGASWDTPFGRLYAQQTTPELLSPESGDKTLLGAEAPFGSGGTVYTEYQWDHSGQQRGLRSLAGIRRDWRITDGLSLLVSGEQATQQLGAGGENEQIAIVGGISYDRNGVKLSTRNELREQRGAVQLDQFASFNYGEVKLASGFTMLGEYRLSETDDRLLPDQSTNFEEASLGFAIRPIDHDRWNVLFKITRLDSEATPTQQDTRFDDSTSDLISADWSLQLTKRIEWVGKHAIKTKLTRFDAVPEIETNTSLSIQRLNLRLPWQLTLGTEFRQLQQDESSDDRSGFLGEIMWTGLDHVGLGVGYNFTEFSSDLRFDSDYSEYGWFLRVQGKY